MLSLKLIIIFMISCNLFTKDKTKKDLTYTDFAYLLNKERKSMWIYDTKGSCENAKEFFIKLNLKLNLKKNI